MLDRDGLPIGHGQTGGEQNGPRPMLGHAGVEAHIYRPSDWDLIVEVLR